LLKATPGAITGSSNPPFTRETAGEQLEGTCATTAEPAACAGAFETADAASKPIPTAIAVSHRRGARSRT
jgi:hypothetical protein